MSDDKSQPYVLPAAAARLLGTTETELRNLTKTGVLPNQVKSKGYPLLQLVPRYTAHLRDPEASSRGVAERAGLSDQMIRNIIAAGHIKRLPSGNLSLIDALAGVAAYYRDESRRSTKIDAERSLKEARQREIEIRIAREENRLIEVEQAIDAVDEVIGAVRSELDGLAARVTRDLELRSLIETEINGVFSRAEKRFIERASDLRAGRDPVQAEAEDDA